MIDRTTRYYSDHYQEYVDKKGGAEKDCLPYLENFFSLLTGKKVLEIGPGLGFESFHFINRGYNYTAVDSAEEFIKALKQKYLNINPSQVNFLNKDIRNINFPTGNFDGIYAQASLLHIPYGCMRRVLTNCHNWLMPRGILYTSFKEGTDQEVLNDGRHFTYFTKDSFKPMYKHLFNLEDFSISPAQEYNTSKRNWLNFYLRKI